MSRCGPRSPARTAPGQVGVGGRIAADEVLGLGPAPARARPGRRIDVRTRRRAAPARSTGRRGRARRARRGRARPAPARRRAPASTASIRSAMRRVGHAEDLAADPGRVGQRPEDVEHGRDAELAPGRAGVAHRRVEPGGEAEADARLGRCRRPRPSGVELDRHPERLQQVGRAARRRSGPVAVLAHRHAGAGDDQARPGWRR